jgi:4-hydroxy-3-methylbut-2-en-1-yl diphosphate reductase
MMVAREQPLRIVLAKPRGFCAGVERAVEIVQRALDVHGPPVYVRHEIVHNKHVVESLRRRGAVFVSELDDVPVGAVTVFSAHGVSRQVEEEARDRSLDVIDATCPLVRKVHSEGRRYAAQGFDVILIGHSGHPEVEGTCGQIPGRVHVLASAAKVGDLEVRDPERVAYVTQTTLSLFDTREVIAALKRRFPGIVGPDTRDICYATQNRQSALLRLTRHVDLILVAGATNSSNSNRLREIGEAAGKPTYLIETAAEIRRVWLEGVEAVGITAAASAPEVLVQKAIERLSAYRPIALQELDGVEEQVRFRLPERLLEATAARTATGLGRAEPS